MSQNKKLIVRFVNMQVLVLAWNHWMVKQIREVDYNENSSDRSCIYISVGLSSSFAVETDTRTHTHTKINMSCSYSTALRPFCRQGGKTKLQRCWVYDRRITGAGRAVLGSCYSGTDLLSHYTWLQHSTQRNTAGASSVTSSSKRFRENHFKKHPEVIFSSPDSKFALWLERERERRRK